MCHIIVIIVKLLQDHPVNQKTNSWTGSTWAGGWRHVNEIFLSKPNSRCTSPDALSSPDMNRKYDWLDPRETIQLRKTRVIQPKNHVSQSKNHGSDKKNTFFTKKSRFRQKKPVFQRKNTLSRR